MAAVENAARLGIDTIFSRFKSGFISKKA